VAPEVIILSGPNSIPLETVDDENTIFPDATLATT
jgi:hypothetical protein